MHEKPVHIGKLKWSKRKVDWLQKETKVAKQTELEDGQRG